MQNIFVMKEQLKNIKETIAQKKGSKDLFENKERGKIMKELKCTVCGNDIEIIEDICTHYVDGEDGFLDMVVTTSGYCTACNAHHIWDERYTFKGYENVEKVED